MSDVVAKEVNILKVDVPRENGRGWKRTAVEINAQDKDLGDGWREGMAAGSKYVIQETWVKANDPHFDAKVLWSATLVWVGKQGCLPGGRSCVGGLLRYGQLPILMALAAFAARRAPGASRRMDATELPAYSRGSVAPRCGHSGSLTDGGRRKLATCRSRELRAIVLFRSVHRNHQERSLQHQLSPTPPGAPS